MASRVPSGGRIMAAMRYGLLLGLACATAMAMSFTLVFYIAQRQHQPDKTDRLQLFPDTQELAQLRRCSNKLIRLTADYLKTTESGAESKAWLAASFRPHLNNLRQILSTAPSASVQLKRLRQAADNVAAMAAKPNDQNTRAKAIDEVLRACEEAERHIRKTGLSEALGERPAAPSFAQEKPAP